MATTLDIVTQALRRANITAKGETPPADEASEALDVLNMMMHGWKAQGADVSHVTLALSDTFALSDEFHEGAVFLLASRLAVNNDKPQPTADGFDVAGWMDAIQAAYTTIGEVTFDKALTRPPSSIGIKYAVSSS